MGHVGTSMREIAFSQSRRIGMKATRGSSIGNSAINAVCCPTQIRAHIKVHAHLVDFAPFIAYILSAVDFNLFLAHFETERINKPERVMQLQRNLHNRISVFAAQYSSDTRYTCAIPRAWETIIFRFVKFRIALCANIISVERTQCVPR